MQQQTLILPLKAETVASPQPQKEPAQAQISADKARKAKQHQIPYWPRPREAIDITTTTERPLQSTASSSGPGKGCQTRFFSQFKKGSSLPEPMKQEKKKKGFVFQTPTGLLAESVQQTQIILLE